MYIIMSSQHALNDYDTIGNLNEVIENWIPYFLSPASGF